MTKAIRDHLRDFLAVLGLVLVALVTTWIIVQNQRLRIPVLEERPFELKAEMETAQAVTPGQGQTVRVAGVRVGDIGKVELDDGNATVVMDIDREFLPIYKDATILLRPKTGLKDMFLELDPGTAGRRRVRGGGHDPGREHRARRQPRRGPPAARQRHPRLPADAAHRRRRGARRPGRGPRGAARQPRPDQPRARQAEQRGRQAQGEPLPADPQHEPVLRQGGGGRRGDRRRDRFLELGAGRDRGAGSRRPAGDQAARADPARDPRCPR